MIRFDAVDLSVAGEPLLSEVTWHLVPGARVGLVGRNGEGKTTLLRAALGEISPDRGTIEVRRSAVVGWLPQHAVSGSTAPLWDEVQTRMVRMNALRDELAAAERALPDGDPAALERHGRAVEAYRLAGGFARDSLVGGVLSGLGFVREDWTKTCDAFSGGWQMRIALARMLLADPDVVLLDEPTNHLDLHARAWLADHLSTTRASVVLVSHDRFLLDRVCQRILEVRQGRVTEWVGNCTAWLAQRERAAELQAAAHARQQQEIGKLERFVERFGAKATKAAQAKSKQKALDRIERIDAPTADRRDAKLRLPAPPDSGHEVLGLDRADIGWPGQAPLLRGVELRLDRGMRLALLGPNGSGKSTLLKVLAGRMAPLAGQRRRDDRARVGVFAQDVAAELDGTLTGLDHVQAVAPLEPTQKVRATLGALGLSGDDALRPVGTLSGGERARVALASLAIKPHNALLLDEPTNHLDIHTVDALCEALAGWPGAMLLVSHDRYLVERVATHVAHVEDGRLVVREGVRPEDFAPVVLRRDGEAPDAEGGGAWVDRKKLAAERRRAEKRLEAVQREIEASEAEVARLEEQLFAEAADHTRARALVAAQQAARERVDALFAEWAELEATLA